MFETGLLPLSICFSNGILSGFYMEGLLRSKYVKKLTVALWAAAYFFIQIMIFELTDKVNPAGASAKTGCAPKAAASVLALFILQLFLYCRDISKQLFAAFSYAAGAEITKYIVSVCYIAFNDLLEKMSLYLLERGIIDTFRGAKIWGRASVCLTGCMCIFIYVLVLSAYLRAVKKRFVKKDYRLKPYENIFLILPGITALCITVTMKMMVLSVEDGMAVIIYEKVPATKFWIPFICFLLLFMLVSSVILFQKLIKLKEEEKKSAILENQIGQMQREVGEIEDIYADIRGLRHDMRGHLGNIAAFLRSAVDGSSEEAADYIGKMEETLSRLDFFCETGNPITDIIIRQKSQEAEKKHIKFQADFIYPVKQQIDAYDIGVVLSNALENAVEACEKNSKTSEEMQEISLHSFLKGNLFFIEVKNDFDGMLTINEETLLPVTGKSRGGTHGIGMSNILRCARKYKGDMEISVVESGGRKQFCLTVMMNGKLSHPK